MTYQYNPLLPKNIDYFRRTNTVQHGGLVYYVSSIYGLDTNTGRKPNDSLQTIGAAISKLNEGDSVVVRAGLYIGNINLNVDSCRIFCEAGVRMFAPSGVALTISSDNCQVFGTIVAVGAPGQTAMQIDGDSTRVENVICTGPNMTCGFCFTGSFCKIIECAAVDIGSGGKGFDILGQKIILDNCIATSNTASYGFYVNPFSLFGLIQNCSTTGNDIAGYYLDDNVSNWTIKDCSSGEGDGKWRDITQNNIWSNFTYENIATSAASVDASNETKSYAVAQVTGIVKISDIEIKVLSQMSSSINNFHMDVWDGTTSILLSNSSGLNIGNAPVGSLIIRDSNASQTLSYTSAADCFISENTSFNKPQTTVIVGQKGDGSDTYIRFTYSTTNTPSFGTIRGRFKWEPISEDGFIKVQ